MAIEQLTMPQLGESVTEGTIEKWLVQAGDYVNKYDPIAEVMTDKVNAEVPSSFSGTIKEIVAEEGTTIAVGDVMCTVIVEQRESSREPTETKQSSTEREQEDDADVSMKLRYSPAVLKLAQQHGIDLTKLTGTGRGGRITRKDVETYIETDKEQRIEAKTVMEQRTKQEQLEPVSSVGDIEIPVSG